VPKTHDGEMTEYSTNAAGKMDICLQKTENIYPFLSPCEIINSNFMKDLNIGSATETSAEIAGNTLEIIGINIDSLSRTQVAQQLSKRIDQWEYMKLKSFCTACAKEIVSKLNRLPKEWEKIFASKNLTRV
jgi:hypothetical protein